MIPETMHCIEVPQPGGPKSLQAGTRPVPEVGVGEILIKVASAGVNRPDVMQRQGSYPPPAGATDILGLEVAGVVAKVGMGVSEWNEGDEVCALVNGGGYAEYCKAPSSHVLPVPNGISLEHAGGIPETFFTVWTNVFDRAGLKAGENFLVHGGSSGIGTTAIQIAKELGARVFTTAGSKNKCDVCLELGAEQAINYREENFLDVLNASTNGMDVILDMVAGDYVQQNISLLQPEGRLVHIAFLGGNIVELNLTPTMLKRISILASTLRHQSIEAKAAIATALRENVWPLIEGGRVRPIIDSTFPLSKAVEAHELIESSNHIGKIILTM